MDLPLALSSCSHPQYHLTTLKTPFGIVGIKGKGQAPFSFEKELNEFPRFAADFLLKCGNIFGNISMTSKSPFGSGTLQGPVSIDPFIGNEFSMSCASK